MNQWKTADHISPVDVWISVEWQQTVIPWGSGMQSASRLSKLGLNKIGWWLIHQLTKTTVIFWIQQLRNTPSVLLFFKIRIIPVSDVVKFRKLHLLINVLINPSVPSSFKQMYKFLSSTRQRTLAWALWPSIPFPTYCTDYTANEHSL
jgi:hypothetical protein